MFELYLNGQTTDEIAKLNPGFGFGIIVRAKVDFDWDRRKEQYLNELYQGVKERIQKAQLEAAEFNATAMSVYHKLWTSKFLKYIQTGNEEDLGDYKNFSFRTYTTMAENLLKLTGQDKPQAPEAFHSPAPIAGNANVPSPPKALNAQEAADLLKIIDAEFTEK